MRWEREAFESRAVWPYRVQDNIIKLDANGQLKNNNSVLAIKNLRNWQPSVVGAMKDNRVRWDLFESESEWTDVNLEFSISIDNVDELRNAVLPQNTSPDLYFLITARSNLTRWRIALAHPLDGVEATISLNLKRSLVAGEIEIAPFVTLAESADYTSPEWATDRAAKLATGFPIYIYADEPEGKPGSGIEIKWDEFPDQLKYALYKLDLPEYSRPVLYLNNHYPELQGIVDSTSKAKNDRTRLRDSIFGFIALDVWMQLGASAAQIARGCEEDEEIPEICERILEALSRRIKWPKDQLINALTGDDGVESTQNIHQAIQQHLAILKRQADLVLEIQEKTSGGE